MKLKRHLYDEIRQRDRDAFDLSKRTGCSFSEAWKALLPEDPKLGPLQAKVLPLLDRTDKP